MQIRPLQHDDVPLLAELLEQLARDFILHESTPEDAAGFLRQNDEQAIRRLIGAGMRYHVAYTDGALAGFTGIRDHGHLFHLFVDRRWQRQGLARRLWQTARQAALAEGGSGQFTVNASNVSVPMYEALGFVRTAPTQCLKGLFYNPMRLADGTRPLADKASHPCEQIPTCLPPPAP